MRAAYRFAFASFVVGAVFPCAYDTSPLFIPKRVPEKIASEFVNGRLGIIAPGLSDRFKLIAWRYLSGRPIEQGQRDAIIQPTPDDALFKAAQQWQDARKAIRPAINPFFGPDKQSRAKPGTYYEDCLPDAFLTAVKTLDDRRTRYANPQMLEEWIAAQDQVFDNCHSDKPDYPADPAPSLSPLARADRHYQIAAAHFYAEDLENARELFRAISHDAASPWLDTGAYMVGRTLIREYQLTNRPAALDQAKAQFQTIPAGPLHDSAQGLIRYIESLQDPNATLSDLAAGLESSDFAGPWREATFVLTSERFRTALKADDLPEPFAWIQAVESRKPEAAVQRWRETHSVVWLTAAMINADAKAPYTAELVEAGGKVARDSPAYETVTYHSMRLLIEGGKMDEARRRLDTLLAATYDLASFSNALRAQRMSIATSFDDYLRWAPRVPIGEAEDDFDLVLSREAHDAAPILDRDSTAAFNQFTPLAKLAEASESARLPEWPRDQIAVAAWTRAFLLGNDGIADRDAPVVAGFRPAWKPDLDAFVAAKGEGRRFAGVLLIARHSDAQPTVWPEFRPGKNTDPLAPVWWCAEPREDKTAGPPPDAVISPAERAVAADEVQRLRATGATQAFVAPIIMTWAQGHPNDARVPEALHRLVRITRYGCYGVDSNGTISKAAFDLLHRRYPASAWAKQTPYWFDK